MNKATGNTEKFENEIAVTDTSVNTLVCGNCETVLSGQFCHSCGQSSKSMIKFFGEVVKELLDDALGYDSRFKHSLLPLLFKPGRLTLDYVKGKRFHYVLPFKLYLITSVLFILIIKNTTDTDGLNFNNQSDDKVAQESSQVINENNKDKAKEEIAKEELEEALEEISAINDEVKNEILDAVDSTSNQENISREESEEKKKSTITIGNGEDDIDLNWNDETQQFDGVDEFENPILKTFAAQVNPKLKHWKEDPEPLIESIIESLPYMMFVILPIFAIFLKLFYAFSKRFYTEHLVFLLHNHSFIYMLMMFQIGLNYGETEFKSMDHWLAQSTGDVLSFISLVFNFWMIIYVFLAMKRFYKQSWKMTIFKTVSLSFVYLVMLSFGFVLTMAFGAYQA